MRYVNHDPAAARRAAAVCRDRAAEFERIAGVVGTAVAGVHWSGCERDQVADATWAVCDDLRREAGSLRATADLLEAAARAAERREADLVETARATAARVAATACRPIADQPSWGPAISPSSTGTSTSSSTSSSAPGGGSTVPAGVL